MVNKSSDNSYSDEKKLRPYTLNTLNGPLRSAVAPVLEIDTTVACQSSYTKVFPSAGNVQDVHGELIGVGQNRSFSDLLYNLTFCGKLFGHP